MSWENFLFFCFSTFMISATPGPNMLLAFQHGINYGVRKTVWTLVGLSFGLFLLLLSTLLGIDILTKQFPLVLIVIKVIGSFYLAYLGIQSWRHANDNNELMIGNEGIDEVNQALLNEQVNTLELFRTGVWVSLSNPKAILFFASFFPKFIEFDKPLIKQYLWLTLGFFLSETTWQLIYTFGGKNLANWLQTGSRLSWLNRSCGLLFVLIAIGLLWEVLKDKLILF